LGDADFFSIYNPIVIAIRGLRRNVASETRANEEAND
tara:strand:+ start:66 stop:176 length:111 start_codon:yes stop_codon:yes gene_type:complete